MGYDIVGDIHGQADKLVALLGKLGYRHRSGAWRHPDRTAIFVGDFIDRGPRQLDTIRTVRDMLDAGTGQAVMGNHEFNAIAWHTPDPQCDGQHLRRRVPKNLEQHRAFVAEAGNDSALHAELVAWFLELPLWLDLPGLRVVHACWHPEHMAALAPRLRPGRKLDAALIAAASRRGSMEYHAVETLTKGIEIDLPAGHGFVDKTGHRRSNVRVRWWDRSADTFRKTALIGSAERAEQLPDTPVPASAMIGYEGSKPVFFGHYWWTGIPAPQADNVACVDYSAGVGGPLVAYRWDGEPVLQASNFVSDAGQVVQAEASVQ